MEQSITGFEIPHKPKEGKAIIYFMKLSWLGLLIRMNIHFGAAKEKIGAIASKEYIS